MNQDLHYLAATPRGSTSRAERNAAQIIAQDLEESADSVVVQPFPSIATASAVYGLHYLLAITGVVLVHSWPLLGAALSLVNAIGYLMELKSYPFFSRILPRDKSQNVIAVKKNGEVLHSRVILVAHYDTSRFPAKLVQNLPQYLRIINISIATLLAFTLLGALLSLLGLALPLWSGWLTLPFALCLSAAMGLLLYREFWGDYGYNDNTSGLTTMSDCFHELAPKLPLGTELWAVATGCKEAGAVGMLRFLELYGPEIREDYIINLDRPGLGLVRFVTEEGVLTPIPADRDLVLAAAVYARDNPDKNIGPQVCKPLFTDATPALARGYKVMSIVSVPEEVPPDAQEEAGEKPDSITIAADLVMSVARQIWAVK